MNELNPEQGEVIGDAPPERLDRHVLTPLLDAHDTSAFDNEMPLDTAQLALGDVDVRQFLHSRHNGRDGVAQTRMA